MNKLYRKKLDAKKGMTMAEMLLVVAIIVILAGVAFIAIMNYQRNMALFERNKIAKEIFIAAQNHLTVAKGQDYPGCPYDFVETKDTTQAEKDGYANYAGTRKTDSNGKPYYYITVNAGNLFSSGNGSYMLNAMLPSGSLEDKVRLSDNYIISYQPQTGKILEVFYSTAPPEKYSYASFGATEYDDLVEIREDEDSRKEYGDKKAVIGWYGGEGLSSLGYDINTPDVKVVNGNKLTAEVYWEANDELEDGDGVELRLVVKGKQSGKSKSIKVWPASTNNGSLSGNSSPLGNGTFGSLLSSNNVMRIGSIPFDATKGVLLGAGEEQEEEAEPIVTNDLDDISTRDKHFATQFDEMIPGEDLEIKVVAYSNSFTANIAESKTVVENSLFGSISNSNKAKDDSTYNFANSGQKITIESETTTSLSTGNDKPDTAYISCIRHLENLDASVSNLEKNADQTIITQTNNGQTNGTQTNTAQTVNKLDLKNAVQTKDLNWNSYIYNTVRYGEAGAAKFNAVNPTPNGCFKPVNLKNSFSYNGNKYEIKGIKVSDTGNAGLFSSLSGGTIKNIKLTDFDINSGTTVENTCNAGALAGSTSGTTVKNVIAVSELSTNITKLNVKGGNAGGLIGVMNGGKVEYSAAALKVQGATNAGGLVGSESKSGSNSAEISNSFSGGHTKGGVYKDWTDDHGYDVNGPAAGGLVGTVSGSTVKDSYSTCSVNGTTTAGGLVGTADSAAITDSYCTGLVSGGTIKAFIGSGSAGAGNKYYSIINYTGEGKDKKEMEPGGGKDSNDKDVVKAFDENTNTFADFTQAGINSHHYDTGNDGLKGKFIFKPVTTESKYFVHTHYGDWPQPETFVVNQ